MGYQKDKTFIDPRPAPVLLRGTAAADAVIREWRQQQEEQRERAARRAEERQATEENGESEPTPPAGQ